MVEPTDPSKLPSATAPTGEREPPTAPAPSTPTTSPPSGRSLSARALVLRLVPLAALLVIVVWTAFELRELLTPAPPDDFPIEPRVYGSNTLPNAAASERRDNGEDEFGGEELPGQSIAALLNLQVERFDPETSVVMTTKLGSGPIARGAVTVVNLWATFCDPCKKEFPEFQTIFARGQREDLWERSVRFVALMLHDGKPAKAAYRAFRNALPRDTEFLIDRNIGPVVDTLKKLKLFPETDQLPATFVLDCRRRVRWRHLGALDAAAFEELDRQIRELRAELGTASCKHRTPTPTPTTNDGGLDTTTSGSPPPPRSKCNRNGVCEPDRGEDDSTCPQDCRPVID